MWMQTRFPVTVPALLSLTLLFGPTLVAGSDETVASQEMKVTGVVTGVEQTAFVLVDKRGREQRVRYDAETIFEELKRNFFREPRSYSPADLGIGLEVSVKGSGVPGGAVDAEWVKFTQDALRIAESLRARVEPVESELEAARTEIAEVQQELSAARDQRNQMGAEVTELRSGIRSVSARTGEALERAGAALDTGNAAHERIGDLDDYRELGILRVGFAFNSAQLDEEARQALDSLAQDVESESGYLLEISGFASSDGDESYNRRLSQKRADGVISYLVEEHGLPRHRILSPYGFGENIPLGDNNLLEGRQQNRRVEVRVLINMGIQPTRTPAG